MMNLNWFRGVIWPRSDKKTPEGKQLYRYVVLGMLITDEPIANLNGNEHILNGNSYGMRAALEYVPHAKLKDGMKLGDANNVILHLGNMIED